MNPDGWKIATDNGAKDYLIGRNNANNVDLNRYATVKDTLYFNV